jgi:hypothetical protein
MVEPAFQSPVAPKLKIGFWHSFHDLKGKCFSAMKRPGFLKASMGIVALAQGEPQAVLDARHHLTLLVGGYDIAPVSGFHPVSPFAVVCHILPGYIDSQATTIHLGIMMDDAANHPLSAPCTAFTDGRRLVFGNLADVALAVNAQVDAISTTILIFDDATGAQVDIDLRGTTAQIISRLAAWPGPQSEARKRGRPKLGVIAREVTLLPRHWDWLAQQPGGASQGLRRLVDQARKQDEGRTVMRLAHERAYRFMSALAGDYPGFEEASRTLFASDLAALTQAMQPWPADVRDYVLHLARPSDDD